MLYLSVFQSYRVFILVCGPSSYNETSYFYTELLAHINPLLNPLVYVLCSKQYRVSVKELFAKCSCKGRCSFCGHTFYLKGKWKGISFIKPASWLLHRSNISLVFPSNLSRSFKLECYCYWQRSWYTCSCTVQKDRSTKIENDPNCRSKGDTFTEKVIEYGRGQTVEIVQKMFEFPSTLTDFFAIKI